MAKILKTDNTSVEVQPKNGRDFSLEELQKIVGGFIEIVEARGIMLEISETGETNYSELPRNTIIVLNEEGKLMGMEFNLVASVAYGNPYDAIVGDVLLCRQSEVK